MAYRTPQEARDEGVPWVPHPGEPANLDDPFHYQTPDDARRLGLNWATQPSIVEGRSPHPAMTALYQQTASRGRLADLLGYGYDDYAGPLGSLANLGSPRSTTMPIDRRLADLFLRAQPAPLTFFSRR